MMVMAIQTSKHGHVSMAIFISNLASDCVFIMEVLIGKCVN